MLCSVLWSAAFLTQDVALGRFGLAVTLGVALAAIFHILLLLFHLLHVGLILFSTFSIFSHAHWYSLFLSDQDFYDVDSNCFGLLAVCRVVL